MNDDQLDRSLRSIGKKCFVKYYAQFSNPMNKNEDLIEILMSNEDYKESGCKTRVSQSRRIIKSGRAADAFDLIIKSQRVPLAVIEIAKRLRTSI